MINKTFLVIRILIGVSLLSGFWIWLESLPYYYPASLGVMGLAMNDAMLFGIPGIIIFITALVIYIILMVKSKKTKIRRIYFLILEILIFISIAMIIMAMESHWMKFSDFLSGQNTMRPNRGW